MRLIKDDGHGNFSLVEHNDDHVPHYAILSHTWGADGEEVTFKDLMEGTSKNKIGYHKIEFCGKQAASDNLQHFWVDTCCIDKSSSAELTEAINSMFRWYKNADTCYVYLSDVSTSGIAINVPSSPTTLEAAFRESRWFTRGWTLQELIAPASVGFYSREGDQIGTKESLEQQIHEITEIAIGALRGEPLTDFEVEERLSWAKDRETKRQEDKAYSLLGIFDVHMPLLYGEGRRNAFVRLRREIANSSTDEWTPQLPVAAGAAFDSRQDELDARCHPATRVDLLRDIHDWAQDPNGTCIFWLSGMAGTGKSTISRTVAQTFTHRAQLGASFFFKRGEHDRENASLFFTTITHDLVRHIPELLPCVHEAVNNEPRIADKSLKEQFDKLIFTPLSKVHPTWSASSIILVIDALDECDRDGDVRIILSLLASTRQLRPGSIRIRVFLTSRPELLIRLGITQMGAEVHRDVALHEISRSTIFHDITLYLEDEFTRIRDEHNCLLPADQLLAPDWPGRVALQTLAQLATPLFIVAATICRFVGDPRGDPPERLATVLHDQTTGQMSQLEQTYLPVLSQLTVGVEEAEEKAKLCRDFREIVGSIVQLANPLSSVSLSKLLNTTKRKVDHQLRLLHSVLCVPSDPNASVQLLHLSFREFLVQNQHGPPGPFAINEASAHRYLADKCLALLQGRDGLRKDICSLGHPGAQRQDVDPVVVDLNIPQHLRYACLYWVHHVQHCGWRICDDDDVDRFLRQYFLHWLESLSLVGKIINSVNFINTLQLVTAENSQISLFLHDAWRFVLTFSPILAQAPSQAYSSAWHFSPLKSIIKSTFQDQAWQAVCVKSGILEQWSACLLTCEGHSDEVTGVVFSPDGSQLASGSGDRTVRVWDVQTSQCQYTLEGHSGNIVSVVFSPDGSQLASGSRDRTVRVWDVQTGQCQHTLEGHSGNVTSVVFSPDGSQLASGSGRSEEHTSELQSPA